MCLLLPPTRLYRYVHLYPDTLTLFFSSAHFAFKHNSFAWKKSKLHPVAEKNVACPQPWL